MKEIHLRDHKNIKINITNAEFNCRVLGNGTINLIAFHGFGQDGFAFLPVAIQNPRYTIYSFDLPFHGKTKIRNPAICLGSQELIDLIENLMEREAIERFSLLGYSIGSKLLLPVLEEYYTQVDHVWLLAPDGIKLNFWYRAATGMRLLRYVFHLALDNYTLLKALGNLMIATKITDKSTISFALRSINTKEKREQVYQIWTYLRKLKLDIISMSGKLKEGRVQIHFILGIQDKIIPQSKVDPLIRKLPDSKTIALDCSHQKLIGNFAEWKSNQTK